MNDHSESADAPDSSFSIETLCALSGVSRRTVRFYTQKGLLDPPQGQRRGAYYTRHHLEQLLLIRRWSREGLSLESIGRRLQGELEPVPMAPVAGTVEVWSRVTLRPGLEVHLEPGRLGLEAVQVRELVAHLLEVARDIDTDSAD
jgi:DNA-binding transcriptional MerR regulator